MALHFGPFVLDREQRRLLRDGRDVPIVPKAFDVLTLLATERPRAVAKDEVLATVWAGVFVSESTLATAIRDLRRALDDDASAPHYVRTVHGFGYAFAAEVEDTDAGAPPKASQWRLLLDGREIALADGPNVIGRSLPDVVVIDAPTISRRHACLVVGRDSVTCEDLGSKNGTWLGTTRVTAPVTAGEGAEIRFGAVVAVLRRLGAASTQSMTSTG